MMNSPVSYMGNDPVRDQLREWAIHGFAASLQNEDKGTKETNDGSKPFNIDLEPIIIEFPKQGEGENTLSLSVVAGYYGTDDGKPKSAIHHERR